MDGVLADFSSAYRDVEVRLFGPSRPDRPDDPEREEEAAEKAAEPNRPAPNEPETLRERRRRHDLIWADIRSTCDFWGTLRPLDSGAVARIHTMMLTHRWEVFFITQRPATDGATVQRQTQRWLVEQGFDLPSVLVIAGSRGAAAGAMRLDYLIDDSTQNCLDVLADSRARPILVVGDDDPMAVRSAQRLGLTSVRAIGEALDLLEQATTTRSQPGLLSRLASKVGWK
jgi:hypothetical protein